jgi:protein-disulfide isomerase
MHKFARQASLAALAAAGQGKYYEISKVFFKHFKELNDETIRRSAVEIGLDMQKFDKDYNDPSLNKIIDQDTRLGERLKVRGGSFAFYQWKVCKKAFTQLPFSDG